MPLLRLTKTSVDKLVYAGEQLEYFDTKLTGFGVRVNQNSKTYFVQGRITGTDGKRRKFNESIGRVGIMPFDDAEIEAKRILEQAAKGITPEQERKRKAMQLQRDSQRDITVRQVHGKYVASRPKLKASTAEGYLDTLEWYLPDWLDLPIRSITSQMVLERHAELGRASRAQADNAMRVLRALCNFVIDSCEELDIMDRNPVRRLSATKAWFKVPRKTRYVRAEDLAPWFAAVLELDELPRMFFKLLLFSGARFTEAAAIRVSNFNFRSGYAVFRETKSGRPLEVPISSYLLPRLEGYIYRNALKGDDFLFPSIGNRKSKSGHVEDLREDAEKVHQASGVKFSPHDLRRTFLSYSATLRVPKLMQKRLTGHAIPDDVTDGYIQIPFEDMEQTVAEMTAYILKMAKQEVPR